MLPVSILITRSQTNTNTEASSNNSYEAEDSVLANGANIHDDPQASNGKYVHLTSSVSPNPTSTPTQNEPALLESYTLNQNIGRGISGYYNIMRYKPRQFTTGSDTLGGVDGTSLLVTDPGPYAGWDVLNTPNSSINRFYVGDSYLILNLNRSAKAAIVWKAVDPVNQQIQLATPLWLSSWTKSNNVTLGGKSYPTYTKSLPAGITNLGGIYDTENSFANQTYLILLAEHNSTPTKDPTAPPEKEKPPANETCPKWLHDTWTTTGPDGKLYATWHPQIDPTYWCYYRHEHGTNPDEFVKGYKPAYNYTATKQGHEHIGEGHPGFKTFVFDDSNNNTWLITMHIGTSSLARVCNRFHSVDIAVKKTNNPEILADIHLMGDFGQAVQHNTTNLIQPPSCPTQGIGVGTRGDGLGQRQIPVRGDGSDGYEPWVLGAKGNILGLNPGWHINSHDPMVICDSLACTNSYTVPNQSGTRRLFSDASHLKIIAGTNSGFFYTNSSGTALSNASDPLALKQFVKPGLIAQYPSDGTKCVPLLGWGKKESCLPTLEANAKMQNYEREDSILAPN